MAAAMSYLYTDIKLMSRKISLSVEFVPCPSPRQTEQPARAITANFNSVGF
jgi:hypothetical protein